MQPDPAKFAGRKKKIDGQFHWSVPVLTENNRSTGQWEWYRGKNKGHVELQSRAWKLIRSYKLTDCIASLSGTKVDIIPKFKGKVRPKGISVPEFVAALHRSDK